MENFKYDDDLEELKNSFKELKYATPAEWLWTTIAVLLFLIFLFTFKYFWILGIFITIAHFGSLLNCVKTFKKTEDLFKKPDFWVNPFILIITFFLYISFWVNRKFRKKQ